MKFLTEILKIKGDWQEVVDDCRATVGKKELGKEPSKRFKIGILIAEHTPIRDIIIKWAGRTCRIGSRCIGCATSGRSSSARIATTERGSPATSCRRTSRRHSKARRTRNT